MSKHITEKQRYAISKMLQVPMSKKDIAEAIGVDRSNIYRVLFPLCISLAVFIITTFFLCIDELS